MKERNVVDFLTYRSWLYQVTWYGMKIEKARKLYKEWETYEKLYKQDKKD